MKDDIATSDHFMSIKVIEFVCLLAKWIAKKEATASTGCKFMGQIDIGSIGK